MRRIACNGQAVTNGTASMAMGFGVIANAKTLPPLPGTLRRLSNGPAFSCVDTTTSRSSTRTHIACLTDDLVGNQTGPCLPNPDLGRQLTDLITRQH